MSVSRPWKDLERRHAKRMRGKRLWRPDFGESMPDGESATDTWDAKCYARFSVARLFEEAEKKYRAFTGSRAFHLVIYDRSRKGVGDLVVVKADRYAQLVELERRVDRVLAEPDSVDHGTEGRSMRSVSLRALREILRGE